MSEFQLYEFRRIDTPLSKKEKEEVNSWSSRTEATDWEARFTYAYSDFRQDEEKALIDYFDAMYYMANWGALRLMFKFPKELVDLKHLQKYDSFNDDEFGTSLKIYQQKKWVIIDIYSHEEERGFWIDEDDSYLDQFLSLRNDILQQDYRLLFSVWLQIIAEKYEMLKFDPNAKLNLPKSIPANFIPPNLKKANSALSSFNKLFEFKQDWIKTARRFSPSIDVKKVQIDWLPGIQSLSSKQKDAYLLRLVEGDKKVEMDLKIELNKLQTSKQNLPTTNEAMSLDEMLIAFGMKKPESKATQTKEETKKKKKKTASKDKKKKPESKKKKAEEKTKTRTKKTASETNVQQSSQQQAKYKEDILRNIKIDLKRGYAHAYAKAVMHLKQFLEEASNEAEKQEILNFVADIKENHTRKRSLIERLKNAGL